MAGGGREPGAEIEAGNHKLGAGAEAHSCEGDSLREFTGSCKSHQTGAYGFLLLLTEIWIRAGRAADFASRPHFEKSVSNICFNMCTLAWFRWKFIHVFTSFSIQR